MDPVIVVVNPPARVDLPAPPLSSDKQFGGNAVGVIEVDTLAVPGSESVVDLALVSRLYVEDMDTFADMSHALINKETVTWTLSGETSVSALGLTYHKINFTKVGPVVMRKGRAGGWVPCRGCGYDCWPSP